ncbi:nuclease-related domain-containing protein [Kitasatospora sp. NPDC085895]|uniref:nuclease-related domain-containing protein n=1 Tax=Kitasatospora sp. NPDC085895 TaxID=3155057 RepID=UPI00344CE292
MPAQPTCAWSAPSCACAARCTEAGCARSRLARTSFLRKCAPHILRAAGAGSAALAGPVLCWLIGHDRASAQWGVPRRGLDSLPGCVTPGGRVRARMHGRDEGALVADRNEAGASAARMARRRGVAARRRLRRSWKWRLPLLATVGVVGWWATPSVGSGIFLAVVAAMGMAYTVVLTFVVGRGGSWAVGAAGERRTARLLVPLERAGWTVLHDRAIPGSSANLDHLLIAPGGEVVYIDTKNWVSRRSQLLVRKGQLWYGGHCQTRALQTVAWEARQAELVLGVPVAAYVAVHGAKVPRGVLHLEGVTIANAAPLVRRLRAGSRTRRAGGLLPHPIVQRAKELLPPHAG